MSWISILNYNNHTAVAGRKSEPRAANPGIFLTGGSPLEAPGKGKRSSTADHQNSQCSAPRRSGPVVDVISLRGACDVANLTHPRLYTIIDCYWSSFLRDFNTNLAVTAAIFCQK